MKRKCSCCKIEKGLEEFHRDKNDPLGRSYRCKPCAKAVATKWQTENRDRVLQKNKKWQENNEEKYKASQEKYHIANKAKIQETTRNWFKKTRMGSHYAALRRAAELRATPKWANLKAIAEFYKNCPKGYHVDHIIPLRNKLICGLHVLENLQYLPATENMRKSNRFTP